MELTQFCLEHVFLWNRLPLSIKQSQSLLEFKSKIKTLRNIVCTCTICSTWFSNYVLWTNTIVIMISIIFQGWFLLAWAIQLKFSKWIWAMLNKDFFIIYNRLYTFSQFDIKDFYPSVKETLLHKFPKEHYSNIYILTL